MGQHNQFEPGWEVPNDGFYIEIGAHPESGNLKEPKKIHLRRGEKFPATSNPRRKWTKFFEH